MLETAGAFALLLFMAFAVTWAGVWVGLMVRDPDGADGIVMSIIFPAMFLSGIFVPVAGLPDGLRQIAEFNPLTSLATALRQLFHSPVGPLPDVFTLQHPVHHVAGLGGRDHGDLRRRCRSAAISGWAADRERRSPCSYANTTACTRSRRPSLNSRLPTWLLTVASVTTSRSAISRLASPCADQREHLALARA